MKKLYAGVGSREIPYAIGFRLAEVARSFDAAGFTLRSGKAKGADSIFSLNHTGPKQEFTKRSVLHPDCFRIAKQYCEGFDGYSDYVKTLMARNVPIFLGQELDDPVELSVLWSPASIYDYGGSAMGMRLCMSFDIPFFNLRENGKAAALKAFLKAGYPKHEFNFPT